jgi:trimethylamine:corrinoid methyltransferase-like protein
LPETQIALFKLVEENTVFAPVYGPPFVRDLDGGRRYATMKDFENFVKLAYLSSFYASLRWDYLRTSRPSCE